MSYSSTNMDLLTLPQHAGPINDLSLRVDSHGVTDRGRARPANEDQILVAELTKRMRLHHSSLSQPDHVYGADSAHLFIVADGMGGHRGGKEASAMAVQLVEEFVVNALQWFFHLRGPEGEHLLEQFQTALQQADTEIYERAMRHPELWGMGTTLTLAFVLHTDLFVAHVGDSRAYLWRDGQLHQLTRDHTLVEEMVRQGMLSEEEAAHHRLRHVITNVLGGTEAGVRADVHRVELQPGDTVLLCSDGLTEMLSDDQIATLLASRLSARQACEQLVSAANDAGGKDNISVIVARFQGRSQG